VSPFVRAGVEGCGASTGLVPSGISFGPSSIVAFDGSAFASEVDGSGTLLRSACDGATLEWLRAGDLESRLPVRCDSDNGGGCVDDGEDVAMARTAAAVGKGSGPVDGAAIAGPGGGGNGVMPMPFLSLAAAAAAADAYLRGSPAIRCGGGAGFMEDVAAPFAEVGRGVCSVANAGRGDLGCVDGLRAAIDDGSDIEPAFCFPAAADFESVSGSSAID